MAAELSPLELLMEKDRDKTAAQRFGERMRRVRVAEGREAPEGAPAESEEAASGVVVGRLTPRLVARLAEALGDADDLEADMIRIAFDIALPEQQPVTAGQDKGGKMHFLADSLSIRTIASCPTPA
ncbi:hypothetical protein [Streptomyces sp. NPDC057002]|uniref:hypothetical protein n=1 Tax=Streptomyces sp. NPDC057002 TaxID=3345992 RepID=UPI00362E9AC5